MEETIEEFKKKHNKYRNEMIKIRNRLKKKKKFKLNLN